MSIEINLRTSLFQSDDIGDALIQMRKDGRLVQLTVNQLYAEFERRLLEKLKGDSDGKNKSIQQQFETALSEAGQDE